MGDVDLSRIPEITKCLEELVESGCTRLTLELAGVTFADANALGLLVRTKRKLEKHDGTLEVFYDDNPYVTRLLDVTGLSSLFR